MPGPRLARKIDPAAARARARAPRERRPASCKGALATIQQRYNTFTQPCTSGSCERVSTSWRRRVSTCRRRAGAGAGLTARTWLAPGQPTTHVFDSKALTKLRPPRRFLPFGRRRRCVVSDRTHMAGSRPARHASPVPRGTAPRQSSLDMPHAWLASHACGLPASPRVRRARLRGRGRARVRVGSAPSPPPAPLARRLTDMRRRAAPAPLIPSPDSEPARPGPNKPPPTHGSPHTLRNTRGRIWGSGRVGPVGNRCWPAGALARSARSRTGSFRARSGARRSHDRRLRAWPGASNGAAARRCAPRGAAIRPIQVVKA